jgi:DNA polymerase family B, exonuclease domain
MLPLQVFTSLVALNSHKHLYLQLCTYNNNNSALLTCNKTQAETSDLMTSWVGIRPLGRAFAATGRYPGTFPHDMDSLVKSINSGSSRGGTVEAFSDEARLLRRVFSLLLHHDPDIIAGHNIVGFDLDVLLASAKRQVSIVTMYYAVWSV